MTEKMDRYNLWLTQLFGTANPKIHKVNAFYGSPAKTYEAISSGDYSVLDKNEQKRLEYVTIDKADRWLDYCDRTGISVCSLGSPEYPKLLAEIYDPPSLLYYRGDLSCLDVLSLTFVGTRHPSLISHSKPMRRSSRTLVPSNSSFVIASSRRNIVVSTKHCFGVW